MHVNRLYKDAIDVVNASKDQELTESLAEYFLQNGLKEGFTATLYTCFQYLRPDIALELAWLYDVMDYAMPFMIQTVKEVGQRVIGLEEENEDRRDQEAKERKEIEDEINDDPSVLLFGISHHTVRSLLSKRRNSLATWAMKEIEETLCNREIFHVQAFSNLCSLHSFTNNSEKECSFAV